MTFMNQSDGDLLLSVVDVGGLENARLVLGELMAVADLNDMELLDNARVQAELLCLELKEDSAAEVDSHDVE